MSYRGANRNPATARAAGQPRQRKSRRRGSIVCLFGLDGSGKTTLAKKLVETLNSKGFDAVYAHPKLGMRIWNSKSSGDAIPAGETRGEGAVSHRKKIARRALAYALLIENWLAVLVRVRHPIAGGKIVVVERYWPDSLVDLVADFDFHFDHARKVAAALDVRAPSAYFMLEVPSHSSFKRKPGPYSLAYLSRRDEVYKRLAIEIGARLVNTQQSPEDALADITRHMIEQGDE